MKIKINDDFGIKTDERNVILCELVDKENGEQEFRSIKYARKIHQILEIYKDHRLRTEEDITSFEEVAELEKKLSAEIQEIKEKLGV